MEDRAVAEVMAALAQDKLQPILWRLLWLEERLPEGRSVDVARVALLKVTQAMNTLAEEAKVLKRVPS